MDITLDRSLAIVGVVAAIVLVVLDKAGKLKGPALLGLLGVAALMTLPLALGNSWIKDTTWGTLKFSKIALMVSLVALCYSAFALWVSQPTPSARPAQITLPPPSLTEVERRAGIAQAETTRRRNLLERLRNEYILSHDNISPALMAGTEQAPTDWVNKRLTELGEKWRVTQAHHAQAATLRITEQKELIGAYQDAKYALQVTIETDKTIQPVHLRVQCDGPLNRVDLREPQRLSQYSYGVVPGEPNVAEVTFAFPPMDKSRPVVLALLADQKVKAIAVRNVQ